MLLALLPALAAELPAAEPSPALRAWIDGCASALGSEDETVRTGAALALGAARESARAALERVAKEGNERARPLAERLLVQLDRPAPTPPPRAEELAPRAAEPGIGPATQWMLDTLALEGEQRTKVAAVLEEHDVKRREVMESMRAGKLARPAAVTRLDELGRELDARLAKLLTPEQKAKYDARGRGGASSADPGGAR
jgi:Spy/CpxP family protein refolding chaperone